MDDCTADFSRLVNIAAVRETDRVLDIAPGCGYSAAVLARMAGSVVALAARLGGSSASQSVRVSGGIAGSVRTVPVEA